MYGILIVIMVVSAIVFVGSVLLMSPKGGLGAALTGGIGQRGEYGSKKSLEGKLKYVALITAILFVTAVLFLPYFLPNAMSA